MTIDWLDLKRTGELRAYMIPPTNLDDSFGELTSIDWSASSITAGYYTDTRTSGQLVVVGDGYKRDSFIRIVYTIPEWNYRTEVGTYAVIKDDATRQNGQWRTTLQLHSMLYTLSTDKANRSLVLSRGATALTAIKKQLEDAGRKYTINDANNYRFSQATVMELGKSRLSRIYELCGLSGNRLDVDGHGNVIVSPYVAPASRASQYEINLASENGIIRPGISRSSNHMETPSSVVVAYKLNESGKNTKTIIATAKVAAGDHADAGVRGYNVVEFYELSDMSPKTGTRALQIAKDKLKAKSIERISWSMECKYLPLWEGDIVDLIVPDGVYSGRRKCVVKSVDFKLPYMDMSLVLKETASPDNDEED